MTQPRYIVPGETVLITVRTIARFYLLRPDPELVDAIKYCLGHYAAKYEMALHAVCVMSTHVHLVAFDKDGNRSLFLRDVNRGLANVAKALRGWRGPVFRPKPKIVRLLTEQAIVDKIGYVLANPVAAGAVKRFAEWPGLCAAAGLSGPPSQLVSRPKHFFSQASRLPDCATFGLELPAALLATHGLQKTRRLIADVAARHEVKAQDDVQRVNWKVHGPRHCLRVNPFQRAKAYEVFGAREPTFAVLGGGKALYMLAAAQLCNFRRAYRNALEQWRNRKSQVRFPRGTWLMRVQHGVMCEGSATPALPFVPT